MLLLLCGCLFPAAAALLWPGSAALPPQPCSAVPAAISAPALLSAGGLPTVLLPQEETWRKSGQGDQGEGAKGQGQGDQGGGAKGWKARQGVVPFHDSLKGWPCRLQLGRAGLCGARYVQN